MRDFFWQMLIAVQPASYKLRYSEVLQTDGVMKALKWFSM